MHPVALAALALCLVSSAPMPSASAASPATLSAPADAGAPSSADKILDHSRQLFYKSDYEGALHSLKDYFAKLMVTGKAKTRSKLRFTAIVAMGRIYLQYKQDPTGAIEWFEKFRKSQSLTEAESDIVNGWIAGARDWIKLGKPPSSLSSSKELFDLGRKYYESGLKKQKYTMDQTAAADFSIAASYLVPLLVKHDKSPETGEALFMMGDLRRRLWSDNDYWSENYYLTEAIRRFPGTPLAVKSYKALEEDVRFGYTGSAGDSTPASWVTLLGELKKIADGETPPPTPLSDTPVK